LPPYVDAGLAGALGVNLNPDVPDGLPALDGLVAPEVFQEMQNALVLPAEPLPPPPPPPLPFQYRGIRLVKDEKETHKWQVLTSVEPLFSDITREVEVTLFENGSDPNAQGLFHRLLGFVFRRKALNKFSGGEFMERHATRNSAIDTVYARSDTFDWERTLKLGRDRETENQLMTEHGLHRCREAPIFPFLYSCLMADSTLFCRRPIDPTGAWYPTFVSGVERACTTYWIQLTGQTYSVHDLLYQNAVVYANTLVHYANQMLIRASLLNSVASVTRRPDFRPTGRKRLAPRPSRYFATTR